MANRKRNRRTRKTTPLREVGVIILPLLVLALFGLQQNSDSPRLGLIAVSLLLVAVIVGGGFYLWLAYKQRRKQKALRALQIAQIDTMSGEEFERYVAELLRFQGYKTRMTPRSGDYGVDIVASKDGVKTAVQAKRYSKKLDQTPIREAVAGMTVKQYGCTKSMVITNSFFTKSALFLAAQSNCAVVDREKLGEWILAFQNEERIL